MVRTKPSSSQTVKPSSSQIKSSSTLVTIKREVITQPTQTQERPTKKPRNVMAPDDNKKDVVVVVGGVEFHENSHMLCTWSEYFEGALGSGTQLSQTEKRIEFPHRDPKEWKLLRTFLDPFDDTTITKDTVGVFLSWFAELSVPRGLEKCDTILLEDILPKCVPRANKKKEDLEALVNALSHSVEYNLPFTKVKCFNFVRHYMNSPGLRDQLQLGLWKKICELVQTYKECRTELWGSIEHFLPNGVPKRAHQDALLSTGVLPGLIRNQILIWQHEEEEKKKGAVGSHRELNTVTPNNFA